VDHLLARGADCVTVLDVSGAALARARTRLASVPNAVEWIEADVTGLWHTRPADIWHDRAVFHFLTEDADRVAYRDRLREMLRPGGTAIIATFAVDGPERCSGLPVMRYSAAALGAELGPELALVETLQEHHRTPGGTVQSFCWSRFTRDRL
jgi:trans-aconitate methyltransferase